MIIPVMYNFSNSYLTECLTLEVTISNKKGYIITLYRCSSQESDKFDSFINNLEKLFINITSCDSHFVVLLDAFITKLKPWSAEEGTILENLTSLYGMKQLASAPIQILQIFLKLH